MRKISLQEIYNRTRDHLLLQGEKASEAQVDDRMHIRCKYRTRSGLKCAVGYWIPDSKYTPELEECTLYSNSLQTAMFGRPCSKDSYYSEPIQLLAKLQNVHDTRAVYVWKYDLKRVAKEFGLEP